MSFTEVPSIFLLLKFFWPSEFFLLFFKLMIFEFIYFSLFYRSSLIWDGVLEESNDTFWDLIKPEVSWTFCICFSRIRFFCSASSSAFEVLAPKLEKKIFIYLFHLGMKLMFFILCFYLKQVAVLTIYQIDNLYMQILFFST